MTQVSWCKVEATVTDPKDFNPFPETDQTAPKEVPPLTVMSLSVRTIVNHQENNREVVCASARIWSNSESILAMLKSVLTMRRPTVQIEDPTPPAFSMTAEAVIVKEEWVAELRKVFLSARVRLNNASLWSCYEGI